MHFQRFLPVLACLLMLSNWAQGQTGCTDSAACNYQPDAVIDDGNCLFPFPGTACDCELDWFEEAELMGGESTSFLLEGAGVVTAIGINLEWENSDGDASEAGDLVWTLTAPGGECWSAGGTGCGVNVAWPVEWSSTASTGYQVSFELPDGLAGVGNWTIDVTNGNGASAGAVYVFEVNLFGFCPSPADVAGCTDATACNYNVTATVDDGSCSFPDACGVCGGNGSTCAEVPGCTYAAACNYSDVATVDNGSCDFVSCLPLTVLGCMYPDACNYASEATQDDGTCEYASCAPVVTSGCTYANAANFDPSATADDGSCTGFPGASACPSDLNEDGAVSTADLLMFLVDYGTNC